MTDLQTRTISAGDKVHHLPSGENWVVLRSGKDSAGDFVEPAGYPPSRARASDCRLIDTDADNTGKIILLMQENDRLKMELQNVVALFNMSQSKWKEAEDRISDLLGG